MRSVGHSNIYIYIKSHHLTRNIETSLSLLSFFYLLNRLFMKNIAFPGFSSKYIFLSRAVNKQPNDQNGIISHYCGIGKLKMYLLNYCLQFVSLFVMQVIPDGSGIKVYR